MRIAVVLAILTFAAAPAAAQAIDDQKLWTSVTGQVDLTRTFRLAVSEELRAGVESGFDQSRTQLEIGARLTDYLGVTALYVLIVNDGHLPFNTVDETRHRIAGEVTLRYSPGRLALSNRTRLQYTTREADSARTEVRDKIKGGYQVVTDVKPYLAVELFYQLDPNSEYRETRFFVGVDWQITERIEVGAFYARQQETNVGSPEHNNVLGLEATYRIRRIKKDKGKDKDKDKDKGKDKDKDKDKGKENKAQDEPPAPAGP